MMGMIGKGYGRWSDLSEMTILLFGAGLPLLPPLPLPPFPLSMLP